MEQSIDDTIFYKFDKFLPRLSNAIENFEEYTHVS